MTPAAAAVAVLAQTVFTLGDLLAVTPAQTLDAALWGSFLLDTAIGQSLATQVIVACLVVASAIAARTRGRPRSPSWSP